MAARRRLGGVAEFTFPAVVLMRAVFDRVFVETVGVGQSETAVAELTDTFLVLALPGAGDELQHDHRGHQWRVRFVRAGEVVEHEQRDERCIEADEEHEGRERVQPGGAHAARTVTRGAPAGAHGTERRAVTNVIVRRAKSTGGR